MWAVVDRINSIDPILAIALMLILYPTVMYLAVLPVYWEDLAYRVQNWRDFAYYTLMYLMSPLIIPVIGGITVVTFLVQAVAGMLGAVGGLVFFFFGQLLLGLLLYGRAQTLALYRAWRCGGQNLADLVVRWQSRRRPG